MEVILFVRELNSLVWMLQNGLSIVHSVHVVPRFEGSRTFTDIQFLPLGMDKIIISATFSDLTPWSENNFNQRH